MASKWHHYHSVQHLRHFVAGDGLVRVFDKARGLWFSQHPKNVGAEEFLYAPGCGPEPRSDAFERWLADNIDGPAAAPISQLVTTRCFAGIDNRQRSILSAYVAAQDLRTPKTRDLMIGIFQRGLQAEWERETANLEAWRAKLSAGAGVEFNLEEVRELTTATSLQVEKPVWLEFLSRNVNTAARRIHSLPWSLLFPPPGHGFLTNDVGLVKCQDSYRRILTHTVGWSAKAFHWVLPLSPTVALAMAPDNDSEALVMSTEWVSAMNIQLREDAQRFVFADFESFGPTTSSPG